MRGAKGAPVKFEEDGAETQKVYVYRILLNTYITSFEVKGQVMEVIYCENCLLHLKVHILHPLLQTVAHKGEDV